MATPTIKSVSEREAARLLGITPSTLMRWRQDGDAPPHTVKTNPRRNCVRYPLAGLQRWQRIHGHDMQGLLAGSACEAGAV